MIGKFIEPLDYRDKKAINIYNINSKTLDYF